MHCQKAFELHKRGRGLCRVCLCMYIISRIFVYGCQAPPFLIFVQKNGDIPPPIAAAFWRALAQPTSSFLFFFFFFFCFEILPVKANLLYPHSYQTDPYVQATPFWRGERGKMRSGEEKNDGGRNGRKNLYFCPWFPPPQLLCSFCCECQCPTPPPSFYTKRNHKTKEVAPKKIQAFPPKTSFLMTSGHHAKYD